MAGKTNALEAWLNAMPRTNAIFSIDRQALYRVPELYQGFIPARPGTWRRSYDYRNYLWFMKGKRPRKLTRAETIAARLHDTGIGEAIDAFLMKMNRRVVAFMGGHDTLRTDPAYYEIARIARALRAKGFTIVTGGGPGLMEAANFGAFMAAFPLAEFDRQLKVLRRAPDFKDFRGWLGTASKVRKNLLDGWDGAEPRKGWSLGVPTWLYGHEPPNMFASHSGKYFFNSVREDGLVSIANGGIIFGPGSAGTVQEVFQDATLNYYRGKHQRPTPMILFGSDFWNPTLEGDLATKSPSPGRKPLLPLLRKLGHDAHFLDAITITDKQEDIIALVGREGCMLTGRSGRHDMFKGRALAAL
jgi:predicted Rossmann-fold nucleotide-binding protein